MTMDSKVKRIARGTLGFAGIHIWAGSIVPMLVGAAFAWSVLDRFPLGWFILAFVGILFVETGKHCFNDVADYISGDDRFIPPEDVTPYSGGKKVLTAEVLTVKEAVAIGAVCMGIAMTIGILIAVLREPKLWPVGMAGIFISLAYSLKPFALIYRGLGELFLGVTYGPLVVMGMYVVLTGTFALLPFLASILIGFHVTNLLWINQFPDYTADKMAGKKNWVVRLGREKSVTVFALLHLALYLGYGVCAVVTKNPRWLLGLATLPLAVKAWLVVRKNPTVTQKMVGACKLTIQGYIAAGAVTCAIPVWTALVDI